MGYQHKLLQRKLLATLLVGTSLGLTAASAGAVTSTLQYLNPAVSGGVGSLSVAPYLPQGASFTSGTLDFSFWSPTITPSYASTYTTPYSYSNSSTYQTGGGYSYSYCCGYSTCTGYVPPTYNTDYYYTNSSTNLISSPAQSAMITVGGNNITASAPSTTTNVGTGTTVSSSSNGNGYNYYTTYLYDNTTTTGGSFNAVLALNPTALGELNNTGLIGYNLQAVGNVIYYQATLTVDYNVAPALTAPVPEPETYAMMLAGLGLLGFTARRRKQSA